jgi:hypothetical protein
MSGLILNLKTRYFESKDRNEPLSLSGMSETPRNLDVTERQEEEFPPGSPSAR